MMGVLFHTPFLFVLGQYLSLIDVVRIASTCREMYGDKWFLNKRINDALGMRMLIRARIGWILRPDQNPGVVWRERTIHYNIDEKNMFWCSDGPWCGRLHKKEDMLSFDYSPMPVGIKCYPERSCITTDTAVSIHIAHMKEQIRDSTWNRFDIRYKWYNEYHNDARQYPNNDLDPVCVVKRSDVLTRVKLHLKEYHERAAKKRKKK